MRFADAVRAHRRSVLFLLVAFAVAGVFAGLELPVGLFPQVSFPRVVVGLEAGDRPAERMAIEVTWPVEEAVRGVPGVRGVRSTTSRGSAEISINFDWSADMTSAMLQVESAVARTLAELPAGTTYDVRRMDTTVFPVLGYSLTSEKRSLVELRDLALYQLRPVLSTVPGVARVGVLGGAIAEYQVVADSAKLDAFGLSLNDVAGAVSGANVVTAVGRMEENEKLYLVVSNTQFEDPARIGATVLRSGPDGLVLLEDVATVSPGTQPQWTRVTADGDDAVLLDIYQQPGGNTVEISRAIGERIAELRAQVPPDVKIAQWYDQSRLIVSSAESVRDAVLIGILLAALVLLAFLRDLKVMLVVGITVPAVLGATVLLLYVFGMTFNIMTLGGLAAAVGLIIDDTIVMIEHIARRVRERAGEGDSREAVSSAAAEFARPLAGSSASTVIIFAPLAFLTGVTGAFFKALSLTVAASLVISWLVAWLVVPLLATRFLSRPDAVPEGGETRTDGAGRAYARVLRPLLRHPWIVLFVLAPLLAVGWLAWERTGSGFMPAMDEGGFILDYRAAPGTSLTETDRLLSQVERILRATPEVETYSRRTGLQLGGGLTEANEGDFFIRLVEPPRRGIEEVMDDVRARVERSVPGLQIEMALLMEDLIGDLTAVPQPIEIALFSDDGTLLRALAPKVAEAIGKVPGVVDVNDGVVLAGDAVEVRVDRERAALEGMAPDDVTQALGDYLTGVVTTEIQQGPKMVGLRVWIPLADHDTARDLEELRLRAPDGHLFPLRRVAEVAVVTGQPQIARDNLKRMVAVTGRISGRDMGSTIRDVTAALDRPGVLPHGVYYRLGGLYEQQQLAFRGMAVVMAAAALLVFALLLFLYESFRVALAMLLLTPLALAAVFVGLWLTGTELNITAMMGMTMVVGIVTEVAIFYYSEYRDLDVADPRERAVQAGWNRMRPIAMTTLAAMLALLPLALGMGQGSAMQRPLAIAIISGMSVQLPLALVVLPSLLALFRAPTGAASKGGPPSAAAAGDG
jgi:CzcA family heavy metal efflux pump